MPKCAKHKSQKDGEILGLLTTFLSVFIASLVIAHILLSVMLRSGSRIFQQQPARASQPYTRNLAQHPSLWSRYSTARGMQNGVDSRVDFIEKLLLKNGSSILAYNLKEKLHNLDNFRANTEVELAAIKEILAGIQNMLGSGKTTPGARKPTPRDESEKLHEIIYHSK